MQVPLTFYTFLCIHKQYNTACGLTPRPQDSPRCFGTWDTDLPRHSLQITRCALCTHLQHSTDRGVALRPVRLTAKTLPPNVCDTYPLAPHPVLTCSTTPTVG